ncbi:MAG: hypothetical protein PHY47_13495 [Lachnospiraceae bacterium]|nr:hypothetical protein [Lachnospiraceae bacterium]
MKITIISCYFGAFPSYFQLWLDSCKENPEIKFLVFSDISLQEYSVPTNVVIQKTTFEKMKSLISRKIGFPVKINSPYKLTDFKVAYGLIFEEHLKEADYWGYCDIDLIFGNVYRYISNAIRQGYNKIYQLGHLTVYKNSDSNRLLFKRPGGAFSYKAVFRNSEFFSFDEHAGMVSISKTNHILEYDYEDMADISCRKKRLTASRQRNYQNQVFYYEKGRVFRAYIDDEGCVKTQEFAYIHLQKRKMQYEKRLKEYYILSDGFYPKIEGIPDKKRIIDLSEYVSDDKDKMEEKKYKINKFHDFLKSSCKCKLIWLKIKLFEIKVRRK